MEFAGRVLLIVFLAFLQSGCGFSNLLCSILFHPYSPEEQEEVLDSFRHLPLVDRKAFLENASRRKVVFESKMDHRKGELYLMDIETGGVERLTHNDEYETNPAVSPDGSSILYARSPDPRAHKDYEIYLMNLQEKKEIRLTDDKYFDEQPDWSPDGRKIVFQATRPSDRRDDIFVMDIETRRITRITSDPALDSAPAWSPDGRLIVFESVRDTLDDNRRSQIYIIDMITKKVTRLTGPYGSDHDPVFSPDGKSVIFTRYEGPGKWYDVKKTVHNSWNLYEVSLEGRERKLTDHRFWCLMPIYDPEGVYIFFTKCEPVFNLNRLVEFKWWFCLLDVHGGQEYRLFENQPEFKLESYAW